MCVLWEGKLRDNADKTFLSYNKSHLEAKMLVPVFVDLLRSAAWCGIPATGSRRERDAQKKTGTRNKWDSLAVWEKKIKHFGMGGRRRTRRRNWFKGERMEDRREREHWGRASGGVLWGQGSKVLWCEVAASTWPQHVAALCEAELTRWKRRLGRGKQKDGEGGGREEWTYCKRGVQGSQQSPQLALSPSLSFLSYSPTGTQQANSPGYTAGVNASLVWWPESKHKAGKADRRTTWREDIQC